MNTKLEKWEIFNLISIFSKSNGPAAIYSTSFTHGKTVVLTMVMDI